MRKYIFYTKNSIQAIQGICFYFSLKHRFFCYKIKTFIAILFNLLKFFVNLWFTFPEFRKFLKIILYAKLEKTSYTFCFLGQILYENVRTRSYIFCTCTYKWSLVRRYEFKKKFRPLWLYHLHFLHILLFQNTIGWAISRILRKIELCVKMKQMTALLFFFLTCVKLWYKKHNSAAGTSEWETYKFIEYF